MENATFARRLRVALAHDGRDDKDVAAAAGVAQDQLSRWKTGVSLPRIGSVARLVDALAISGHWLLTGDGSMEPGDDADTYRLEVVGKIADGGVSLDALRRLESTEAMAEEISSSAATGRKSGSKREVQS